MQVVFEKSSWRQKLTQFLFVNRSDRQTAMKNSLWLTIGEVLARSSLLLILVFAARWMGPGGYGSFAFALSVAMIFTTFTDMGLSTFATIRLARRPQSIATFLHSAISLKLFYGLCSLLLLSLLAVFVASDARQFWLIIVLGMYVLGNSAGDFARSIFRGQERFEYEALSKAVHASLLLSLGFGALLVFESGFALSVGLASSSLASALFISWVVAKKWGHTKPSRKIRHMKNMVAKSWAFGLSGLLVSISFHFDSVILGLHRSDAEVGGYSAMYRVLLICIMGVSFLFTPLLPILSRKSTDEKLLQRFNLSLFLLIVPTGLVATLGVIWSRDLLISLLYGSAYLPYSYLLQVLPIVFLFILLREPAAYTLAVLGMQSLSLRILAISSAVNVALNCLLIPQYGAIGAAVATVSSELINLIVFNYCLLRVLGKLPSDQRKRVS